jgi:hypothetical protein
MKLRIYENDLLYNKKELHLRLSKSRKINEKRVNQGGEI